MHYQQFQPSAAAAECVEFYWTLEDASPPAAVQTVVPDGRSGIILNFDRPFESQANGAWTSQPECFFVGQLTRPLSLRPSGSTAMVGVQFRPQGAARLIGMPMAEVSDTVRSVEDLSRGLHREFERIRDLGTPARAVRAIDHWASGLATAKGGKADPLSDALVVIEASVGLSDIGLVAHRVGWTVRQLERSFKERVGITPKFFARMQRFQEVLRNTDEPGLNWADVAMRCGYFDQAHLIRDFRQFSGKPPTAILDTELDFTKRFVRSTGRS